MNNKNYKIFTDYKNRNYNPGVYGDECGSGMLSIVCTPEMSGMVLTTAWGERIRVPKFEAVSETNRKSLYPIISIRIDEVRGESEREGFRDDWEYADMQEIIDYMMEGDRYDIMTVSDQKTAPTVTGRMQVVLTKDNVIKYNAANYADMDAEFGWLVITDDDNKIYDIINDYSIKKLK